VSVDLVLGAVEFDAPLANPSPSGLYSAVTWVQDGGDVARWLGEGVRFTAHNYGAEDAVGVWDAPWCGDPGSPGTSPGDQLKVGVRPARQTPFQAATLWAYDACDPTEASRAEVDTRVQQNLRLMEQTLAEMMLAQRMLADAAGSTLSVPNLRDALSYAEGQLAMTGTLGVVHANPEHASQEFGLVVGNGPIFRTPLAHQWVFGGGYVSTLNDTVIATSPLFGWRTDIAVRVAFDQRHDQWISIAERSVLIGYEQLIAAASFT
jgi:hypothetical protein